MKSRWRTVRKIVIVGAAISSGIAVLRDSLWIILGIVQGSYANAWIFGSKQY